jgi:hypothetical protein
MRLVIEMVGNALKTSRNIILVVLLIASLLWNATTLSLGVFSIALSSIFEAVTGAKTVASQLLSKKEEAAALRAELSVAKKAASKAEGMAAGRGLMVVKERAANAAMTSELKVAKQLASRLEGKAAGAVLALEKELAAKAAMKAELAALRVGRKYMIDGVDVTLDAAVMGAAKKVKLRTAKLATTNLAAVFGQALPWIGASVVVAVTAYDLDASCETMKDMQFLEAALNPQAQDAYEVERICGLKVPSEEEVWEAIKASPGNAWEGAKGVLVSMSTIPTMPEFGWPSLPQIGLPEIPAMNWTFWQ